MYLLNKRDKELYLIRRHKNRIHEEDSNKNSIENVSGVVSGQSNVPSNVSQSHRIFASDHICFTAVDDPKHLSSTDIPSNWSAPSQYFGEAFTELSGVKFLKPTIGIVE